MPGAGAQLAGWGGDFIRDVVEAAGLQPPELGIPRPVIVNTIHILETEPSIGASLSQAKRQALSGASGSSGGSNELALATDIVLDTFESAALLRLEEGMRIGEVDLFGVYRIPIDIELPQAAIDEVMATARAGAGRLRGALRSSAAPSGWSRWE